ncbi:family transcriptional regulator, putative [Babesia ovata]|uniref:Family transcriptional regulator, putative n=1 Tax=Babesia ovata TaxID=189622 RepID=A0A2H6KH95_9APIC|nr:family transcriptional regulator, putative [Babesia ovata]GBE62366.1 family transcriptional regulator, putative [Babesia ovata]
MAWSQCSNTLHCTSKFYDECESASENFLCRGRQPGKTGRSGAAAIGSQRRYNLLAEISRSLSCCFGRREEGEATPQFSHYGIVVNNALGSGRSNVSSITSSADRPAARDKGKACPTLHEIAFDSKQMLWTIEPTTSHRNETWTLDRARWMALAWASRVTNGEPITRRMMNGLLVNAMRPKNSIEGITKAVMKNFQGLELVDNIACFETVDQTTAIDTIFDTLSEHSAANRLYFAIIVKKGSCCHAVYYNNRGDERDVVLLECGVASKHGGIKCGRMIAFNRLEAHLYNASLSRLESMREYLLNLDVLQISSTIYGYTFSVKSVQHLIGNCKIRQLGAADTRESDDKSGHAEAESIDPRKDAKLVFSHAKGVAKM